MTPYSIAPFASSSTTKVIIPTIRTIQADQLPGGVAGGAAQLIALDADTKLISIKTGCAVKIAFGGADVVADASDHGFFAGEKEVVPVFNPLTRGQVYSHISIYFVESGTVYVSERE